MTQTMPSNEHILAIDRLISLKSNPDRAYPAWAGGYNCKEIDGKYYPITNIFKTNRSKCFRSVMAYILRNNVPHKIEQVNRQWPGTRLFKQWDITLL